MNRLKLYKIATVFLIFQWALYSLVAQHPYFIEKYYSKSIYPEISKILRILFGWVNFSVGDLFYTAILFVFVYIFYTTLFLKRNTIKYGFYKLVAFVSLIYFIFNTNWGINYFRQPLFSSLHLENKGYSKEDLENFTKKLIHHLNESHTKLVANDSLAVLISLSHQQIIEKAVIGYKNLALIYPELTYENSSIKFSIFSLPLTYMGFAGYLNPFTNEAQMNYLLPKNLFVTTTCHEISHQLGIASESEANFLGYLSAVHTDDPYFKYAAQLLATRFCMTEIYKIDKPVFENLKNLLHKGILKDIKKDEDFWNSYQNWSEKYFQNFYGEYLKVQKQYAGLLEYNKMVALLINYYKVNTF